MGYGRQASDFPGKVAREGAVERQVHLQRRVRVLIKQLALGLVDVEVGVTVDGEQAARPVNAVVHPPLLAPAQPLEGSGVDAGPDRLAKRQREEIQELYVPVDLGSQQAAVPGSFVWSAAAHGAEIPLEVSLKRR